MNPTLIISVMRTILREQNSLSYHTQEIVDYIFNNGLLHLNYRPWNITLTTKGEKFIRKNS